MTKGTNKDEKHWIITDLSRGNIFFLAIYRIKNRWYISEYINYFGLCPEKLQEYIQISYTMIIDATRNKASVYYDYIVHNHTFEKDKMGGKYWSTLLHNQPVYNARYHLGSPVNKKRLETEIKRLLKPIKY